MDYRNSSARRKTLALVLEGSDCSGWHGLTQRRASPALPFGGHHRIVDYVLSNCIHSAIPNVAVVTEHHTDTLVGHLQRNWLSRGGVRASAIQIWPLVDSPSDEAANDAQTSDRSCVKLLQALDPDDVLVLSGSQIYEMDYTSVLEGHMSTGADVTMACVETSGNAHRHFGLVETDPECGLTGFIEQSDYALAPVRPDHAVWAAMGVFVFSADYLIDCLSAEPVRRETLHDSICGMLPKIVGNANIVASPFRSPDGGTGYWSDVCGIDSYWSAHMDLLHGRTHTLARVREWPILGSHCAAMPSRIRPCASIDNCIVASDTDVSGAVQRSILSRGCRIDKGSGISDSVLLPNATVGRNCVLNRVIVDSHCHVPDDAVLDATYLSDVSSHFVSPDGIVLVTAESLSRYGMRSAVGLN